jgi:beta-glucanase (GH16 family)
MAFALLLASVGRASAIPAPVPTPAATPKALDPGWVRVGPLGELPTRSNDRFPLSDQGNRGGWQPVEALWDEFAAERPDATKWFLTHGTWAGRAPFAFDPANVSLRDGELVLRATGRLRGEAAEALPAGFTHTAAFVRSKATFHYGYAEIRATLASSSVDSCFFLMNTTHETSTEIDVFEIAAADPIRGRRMGMSRHVMKLPGYTGTYDNHLRHSETWVAPFSLGEGYHVFGLEWNANSIAWYLDGVLLHRAKNDVHRFPLRIILDLEPHTAYLENAMEHLLPAEFRIDYVRVWTGASARAH